MKEERHTWTIRDATDDAAYEVVFPEPLPGDGEQVGVVYLGGKKEERVRIGAGPACYTFTSGIPSGRGLWVYAADLRWLEPYGLEFEITERRFDHREERARRERVAAVAEAKRQMAPIIEMIGSDVEEAKRQMTTEVEEVKSRLPKKGTSGRPRTVKTGKALIARAHRRRTHEGRDADEVARELYPKLYHESPPQARKRVYDADYTAKQQCPDCQQAVAAGIEKI